MKINHSIYINLSFKVLQREVVKLRYPNNRFSILLLSLIWGGILSAFESSLVGNVESFLGKVTPLER